MLNQTSRRAFLKLTTATAALALAGCVDDIVQAGIDPAAPVTNEDAKLLAFFSKSFTRELEESPEFMTALGMKKRYGEWDDYSDAFAVYQNKNTLADLEYMKMQIDRAALSPSMRVSYDIFLFRNEQRAANHPYRFHRYAVSHFGGPHQDIPNLLINRHRIADAFDAQAYIARIAATDKLIDQTITSMREQQAKGITLPRFSYKLIIDDARKAAKGADILADFKKKVEKLDGSAQLIAAAEEALTQKLQPAYARFIAAAEDIGRTVKSDHGAGTLPDGAAFYDQAIASHTTLKMSANEIHELGLSEVARLSAEMETVKKRLGFKGPLKAFYADLRTNPRYLYPESDQGRAAYLARALELQRKAYAALPAAFGTLPKAQVEVKRMEPFLESGQTIAFYNQPSPDGSRPGFVFYNLASMATLPKWQMAALAFHEGIPGHHMQIAIAQETKTIPEFRKHSFFTAYIEGWALYTELLSKEMGLYVDDLDEVGRITMELWRACRLVVDTGIHAKGWTREKSVGYFLANTALTRDNIVREIDRYFVWPGQACAYQIGKNKILELRERAKAAMGPRFDIRKYHDTVLENGGVPLPVLETIVADWSAR
ncbi:MAG: DUF885 domain-containing protein [Micropepsaceae bacterium]